MKENKIWNDIQTDWTNSLKLGADITKSHPEWIHSIFEEVKIASDFLLPQIVAPGTPMGAAESELAEKLGISNATICQGMTDGTAGSLTMGLLNPNDTGINVGSTTVPKIVVEKKEDLPIHPAIYYHRHPIKGYLAGAATGAAGSRRARAPRWPAHQARVGRWDPCTWPAHPGRHPEPWSRTRWPS